MILWIIVILIAAPLIVLLGEILFGLIGSNVDHFSGEEIGTIQNLEEKGVIWKTWEVELSVEKKYFNYNYSVSLSVDNNDINKDIILEDLRNSLDSGDKVKITYEKKTGKVPWRSKTPYLIKKVTIAENVSTFAISYYDRHSTPLTSTPLSESNRDSVRRVVVRLGLTNTETLTLQSGACLRHFSFNGSS